MYLFIWQLSSKAGSHKVYMPICFAFTFFGSQYFISKTNAPWVWLNLMQLKHYSTSNSYWVEQHLNILFEFWPQCSPLEDGTNESTVLLNIKTIVYSGHIYRKKIYAYYSGDLEILLQEKWASFPKSQWRGGNEINCLAGPGKSAPLLHRCLSKNSNANAWMWVLENHSLKKMQRGNPCTQKTRVRLRQSWWIASV